MAALPDDLIELFLRRLPPEDPVSLVRASLVCKCWRRVLAERGFCRRLCETEHEHYHRMPAMLGFFGRGYGGPTRETNPLLFTPTSSFRPRTAAGVSLRHRYVADARHGRVLLAGTGVIEEPSTCRFAVWDPITGGIQELPRLPRRRLTADFTWKAVVLCACASLPNEPSTASSCDCDHLEGHRGPFLVVFVGTSEQEVYAYVYSSHARAWSHTASAVRDTADRSSLFYQNGLCCSTVAGNAVYLRLLNNVRVLKYDLSTQKISSVGLPDQCRSGHDILLTTTHDGGLGVAIVDKPMVYLCSREADPDHGLFRWAPTRAWAPIGVVDISAVRHTDPYYVVDILHSLGAIIIWAHDGVFSVDIDSSRVTKLCEDNYDAYSVPYMSFCMPAVGAAFTGEEPSAGISKCKKNKNKNKKIKLN